MTCKASRDLIRLNQNITIRHSTLGLAVGNKGKIMDANQLRIAVMFAVIGLGGFYFAPFDYGAFDRWPFVFDPLLGTTNITIDDVGPILQNEWYGLASGAGVVIDIYETLYTG